MKKSFLRIKTEKLKREDAITILLQLGFKVDSYEVDTSSEKQKSRMFHWMLKREGDNFYISHVFDDTNFEYWSIRDTEERCLFQTQQTNSFIDAIMVYSIKKESLF